MIFICCMVERKLILKPVYPQEDCLHPKEVENTIKSCFRRLQDTYKLSTLQERLKQSAAGVSISCGYWLVKKRWITARTQDTACKKILSGFLHKQSEGIGSII